MSYNRQATQAEIEKSDANVARLLRMSTSDFMQDMQGHMHTQLPPLKYPLRGRKPVYTPKLTSHYSQADSGLPNYSQAKYSQADYMPSGSTSRYHSNDSIPPLTRDHYLTIYDADGNCMRIDKPDYGHLYAARIDKPDYGAAVGKGHKVG